jgi:hypothetical protein
MEAVEVSTSQLPALDSRQRAELDNQITTAKAYPRSVKRFMDEAMALATLNEDVAASCIYALPRGGKPIEGPSARLAEIVASAWGNLNFGARVVSTDARFVTAQGVARDLERNVTVTFEVQRRITDKKGGRFNDDMIVVTSNAASSIALRNCVFKVVPKAFWGPIYEAARMAAVGDVQTIESRRHNAVAAITRMGVPEDRIYVTLGVAGIEDVGPNELATLRGLFTALRDGDTTPEEAFPAPVQEEAPTGSRVADVKKRLSVKPSAPVESPAEPKHAPIDREWAEAAAAEELPFD